MKKISVPSDISVDKVARSFSEFVQTVIDSSPSVFGKLPGLRSNISIYDKVKNLVAGKDTILELEDTEHENLAEALKDVTLHPRYAREVMPFRKCIEEAK